MMCFDWIKDPNIKRLYEVGRIRGECYEFDIKKFNITLDFYIIIIIKFINYK